MTLTVVPVTGLPEVVAGDDLADLVLAAALPGWGCTLADGDVLVVSSKVASKAAGLTAPDREAAIVAETVRVVAERRTDGRLTQVVESAAGPVMAAAGVDASNTGGVGARAAPAPRPRRRMPRAAGRPHGGHGRHAARRRAQRHGRAAVAGRVRSTSRWGRPASRSPTTCAAASTPTVASSAVTMRALADEIASAADLVKGKADGVPVALVRGLDALVPDGTTGAADAGARSLVRTGPGDWFALGHVEAVRAALGVEPGSALANRFGIMDVAPEPPSVAVGRAVAVAVHDLESVGVDVGADHVVVTGPDPVEVGMAVARVAVALWGEGYDAAVAGPGDRTPQSVRVTLSRR